MLDDEEAIDAARQAIVGKVEPVAGAPVTVRRSGPEIVVEFGHPLAPGGRGPDYDAQVRLDAETGSVLGILGGS